MDYLKAVINYLELTKEQGFVTKGEAKALDCFIQYFEDNYYSLSRKNEYHETFAKVKLLLAIRSTTFFPKYAIKGTKFILDLKRLLNAIAFVDDTEMIENSLMNIDIRVTIKEICAMFIKYRDQIVDVPDMSLIQNNQFDKIDLDYYKNIMSFFDRFIDSIITIFYLDSDRLGRAYRRGRRYDVNIKELESMSELEIINTFLKCNMR